ncbi:tRNA pseudouridine(55) synthase [Heracleum sosnowskyi]|uniref:tRNA pseudouridine(55) synthase n=1 Tax=Heracleum sosnowskyi TaxID=360622 RepID=A0AAD8H846_9APIA|nr:tRNA pseudouridine(55) synthase [Heracleum sosnowskyi]
MEPINGHDKSEVDGGGNEMKVVIDGVRSLPHHALKHLLSLGVCVRCIFRIFGVHECLYSSVTLSTSLLCSNIGKELESEGEQNINGSQADKDPSNMDTYQELLSGDHVCRICLGILQFVYYDQQNMWVKRDSASAFALTIADFVKQDGHVADSFSLEVSLPPLFLENEESVLSVIKKKYHSEEWYQKIVKSELVSTKDVLKLSLTSPLESLMGVKSGLSSLRIRLTYTNIDALKDGKSAVKNIQCNKRRKTDDGTDSNCVVPSADIENSNVGSSEEHGSLKSFPTKGLQNHEITDFHLEEVKQPCHLTFACLRAAPIYIGGRYLKYSRNVSQSRWIIDDERMGEASVEEIIGGNTLPMFQGDSYKFHAAGREDIDVRMLGSGRPFLIEIQNARLSPSNTSICEIERRINCLESRHVMVKNLKVLGSEAWNLMREGEAEKQKQYVALVWISRFLKDGDLETISSLKDIKLLQKTPVRVLHRRSPLEREKIIHWMKIERIASSSQYFLLHLCTQAGTYIKEFVHGDLGRTYPSIGSILGCRAEILQLDVTDVKMDCFLSEKIQ